MKKNINLLCIFFLFSSFVAAAPPKLWGKLQPGPYQIGFRIEDSIDNTRFQQDKYDSTGNYKANRGRPMQVAVWYPSNDASLKKMSLKDYIEQTVLTYNRDPLAARAAEVNDFKEMLQLPFVFGLKNISAPDLESAPAEKMFAAHNAPALKISSPVILSIGDPYFLAVTGEYLASRGYTVCVVSAPGSGKELSPAKRYENGVRDMEWLYGYLYTSFNLEKAKTAVMGMGGGSQAPFYLAMKNKEIDAFVNIEGGIFGRRSESDKADSYDPDAYSTPLLDISIVKEQEDMPRQIAALKNAILYRFFLKSDLIRHHDFPFWEGLL